MRPGYPAEVTDAAAEFAAITRIDCQALGMEPTHPPRHGGCCICDAALRGHLHPTEADSTHRFAAYQSERLGGRYVYTCPYTLLHAATPVLVDDALVAVIVCGPAVLGTVDDQILGAIQKSPIGSMMSTDAAAAWVHSLPQIGPGEATALAATLARVARSCCDQAGSELLLGDSTREVASDMTAYVDHLTTMEGDKRSSMHYPVDKERELMERVTAGDRAGAEALLADVVRAVSSVEVGSADEARSRVLELVVLLSRAALAGGADVEQVFGLEYRSLTRLRTLDSIDEVTAWLSRILRRFIDLVFDLRHVRYSAHLSRVLRYVRDQYRNPVTLADAAREAGLSPGYLGRIFRSELQSSFTRYVQTVRIQEARRLLRKTRIPVGDVGAHCGFGDHSYFTQVFRKETGVAPSEYREGTVAS